MRAVFFILACIIGWCYGLVQAGTERETRIKMLMESHPHSVFLPMPEAIVTEDKIAHKAEVLLISGDKSQEPTIYWVQQDTPMYEPEMRGPSDILTIISQ